MASNSGYLKNSGATNPETCENKVQAKHFILAAASAGNAGGFTFSVAPYLFINLVWGPLGQALNCLVRE